MKMLRIVAMCFAIIFVTACSAQEFRENRQNRSDARNTLSPDFEVRTIHRHRLDYVTAIRLIKDHSTGCEYLAVRGYIQPLHNSDGTPKCD
jgi:hypothetical protein